MQYDKIQYIVALISEFSKRYNLTNLQVERKALEKLKENENISLTNKYYILKIISELKKEIEDFRARRESLNEAIRKEREMASL